MRREGEPSSHDVFVTCGECCLFVGEEEEIFTVGRS